jgi:translation initiation factor eIF-2B subunit delta
MSYKVKNEIDFLSSLGVEVVVTYISGISGIINSVNKIFIKAKAMLSNGNLLGAAGTAMITCIAYNFKKPVIAICETSKFWDKMQMDASLYSYITTEKVHM